MKGGASGIAPDLRLGHQGLFYERFYADPPPPPAVLNASPGLVREDDTTGDGLPDATRKTWQPANAADQLQQIITAAGVGTTPPAESEVAEVVHDRAGNLVYDGWLFYQYDAFNRLTQVNVARDAATVWIDHMWFDNGRLVSTATPGPLLARFHYDALGRLMRTERFDRADNVQVEDYYYDGVRRVAEVEQTQPATGSASWAYRDYVYGPGYVDEVVAQVAFDGGTSAPPAGGGSGGGTWVTYYYLQDANYNVVAVLSSEPGGSPPAAPVVLASFTYDPYGNTVFAEYAPTLPAAAARALAAFADVMCSFMASTLHSSSWASRVRLVELAVCSGPAWQKWESAQPRSPCPRPRLATRLLAPPS